MRELTDLVWSDHHGEDDAVVLFRGGRGGNKDGFRGIEPRLLPHLEGKHEIKFL